MSKLDRMPRGKLSNRHLTASPRGAQHGALRHLAPTGVPRPNAVVEVTLMMEVTPVVVVAVAVEGAPLTTVEANTVVPAIPVNPEAM